jgi:hypothetical protein
MFFNFTFLSNTYSSTTSFRNLDWTLLKIERVPFLCHFWPFFSLEKMIEATWLLTLNDLSINPPLQSYVCPNPLYTLYLSKSPNSLNTLCLSKSLNSLNTLSLSKSLNSLNTLYMSKSCWESIDAIRSISSKLRSNESNKTGVKLELMFSSKNLPLLIVYLMQIFTIRGQFYKRS